ncbi:hypothetical protein Moror_7586 [Moniliophthora roreri MCA 2997]|uniref:Secreted protein n=1 Tax=Moniliophthora roreri (strain MCA 2997) TaxID=1381753 RepID=V2WAR0_MONRO|nr:hypothetical protein Moror_7586 [Moniliophthora roreri MCA 2997]
MLPLHLRVHILILALSALFVEAARVCFKCPSAATIFLHHSNPDSELQLPLVVEDQGTPGTIDEGLFCEYKSAVRGRERAKTTFCTYWASGDIKEWGWGARCPGEAVAVVC